MSFDLTLTGATFDTAAPILGSASLSGGYGIPASSPLSNSGVQSVELAFQITAAQLATVSQYGGVVCGGSGFYVAVNASGTLTASVIVNGTQNVGTIASGSAAFADGATHWLNIVSDPVAGTTRFLLDNVLACTISQAIPTSTNFAVGNLASYLYCQWPGKVDEVSVWTIAKTSHATAAYAGNETGLVALYHLDGNGADSRVTTVAAALAPNNALLFYSPCNWSRNALVASTSNSGAYLRHTFTGAAAPTYSFTMNAASAASYVYFIIDGHATRYPLAASITPTMPGDTSAWTTHEITMLVSITDYNSDRWSAPAIALTGITPASGSSIGKSANYADAILIFGDSITEGALTLGAQGTVSHSDALYGWAYRLRALLGVEVGIVGWSSQGVTQAGLGSVPAFTGAYNQVYSGAARDFTTVVPKLILVALGQNDQNATAAALQSGIGTVLRGLLAATPATTQLRWARPLSGVLASTVQAGIAAVGSSRAAYLDTAGFWDGTESSDGTHPYGSAATEQVAPAFAAALKPLLGNAAAGASYTYF